MDYRHGETVCSPADLLPHAPFRYSPASSNPHSSDALRAEALNPIELNRTQTELNYIRYDGLSKSNYKHMILLCIYLEFVARVNFKTIRI